MAVGTGWRIAMPRRDRLSMDAGFDIPGFILSGVGLALILYALNDGSTNGWDTVRPIALGIVGVVSFALYLVHDLIQDAPRPADVYGS